MGQSAPDFHLKNDIRLGYKDPTSVSGLSADLTKYLYNLPTLNVLGSSANNYAVSVSLANGIQCINFPGGVLSATIQTATLTTTAPYFFVNTSGTFPVSIKLDSGGLFAGLAIYPLNSGTIVQVVFDGTNLHV